MKITTSDRKMVAVRLGEITGTRPIYTRMPRCAYEVGGIFIELDGTITVDTGADLSPLRSLYLEGLIDEDPEQYQTDEERPNEVDTVEDGTDDKSGEESDSVEERPATSYEEKERAQAQDDFICLDQNLDAACDRLQDSDSEKYEGTTDTEGGNDQTDEAANDENMPFPCEQDVVAPQNQAEPLDAEVDTLTISFPLEGHTLQSLKNLAAMIYSRGALISKSTGGNFTCTQAQLDEVMSCNSMEALCECFDLTGVTISNDKITFTGFPYTEDIEQIQAYQLLAAKMIKIAKEKKRIIAKRSESENEKFLFRTWLLSLGFIGSSYKTARKALLAPLSGFSAFPDQESKERFETRQKALREARRETSEN